MSTKSTTYNFLQGGGDMGRTIRAKDWGQTPLGDPSTWPQPLKNMVGVMLDNPLGMYIAWGKDHTQIYNDGFRPILGELKHPKALGISSKESLNEIWHIVGPMFDDVMAGNTVKLSDFMVQLNRNGYVETCYFDFAYSPIRLDSGVVGGVLATVIETTDKKKAEDALEDALMVSKNELEFVLEAAQLGAFDYNPLTHTFSANARLKEWFGLPPQDQIELTQALDAIAETDRERVSQAIKTVLDHSSDGTFNEEYTIIHAHTNKERIVHAKGKAWYNEYGIAQRVTGTLEDVTDQVMARKKIEDSEKRYNLMLMQSPFAFLILKGKDLIIDLVNESMIEIIGKGPNIEGKPLMEVLPEITDQSFPEMFRNVYETGIPISANEMPVKIMRNGTLVLDYYNYVFQPYHEADNSISGVTVIAYNVTNTVETKKEIEISEKRYRNLIHSSPSGIAILYGEELIINIANNTILEIWGRDKNVVGKSYFEVLPDIKNQITKAAFLKVYKSGTPYTALETPVEISQNGETHLKYYNFVVYPQKDLEGNVDGIGIIATEVTSQALLNNQIKESEQNMRALVDSAPFPIGVYVGQELRITLANQSIMDIWGKGNDVVGKLFTDILPELEEQHIFEQLRGVLDTGIPFHAKDQKVNLLIDNQLTSYYFNYSYTPLLDSEGNVIAVMNTAADVTALHEAKQKVEESERRFRDSVKQAPIGIAIFRGPDHVTEMANESYLQLVEKTESQFVGKPLFESLPEAEESIAHIVDEIFKTGKTFYGYEFPVKLKIQGKTDTHYFNFVYQPLKENNVISGFMVVVTEVTATVIAKQLIEENEEKLELIIEASELGVFDVNLKTGVSDVSERCYEILGFSKNTSLVHKDLIANMLPEDLDTRKKGHEKAYKDGILHYQARVFWPDNTIHWIEVKGRVFFDSKKDPERIVGTVRDITEEKTFNQQLVEREEKFRLLAEIMPQYIWTADPEGNLNYFNQSMYDFAGLKEGELNNEGWIQMVHPDDREENMKAWRKAIRTGKKYLFEQRFRKHDGEYRWQLSRAIPQRDKDGVIKMWVGTSTDIQDQKMFTNQLEKMVQLRTTELEEKNTDLENMNKELQSFVYISSHDLQEPLRKIQTFSSRILDTEYSSLSETAKKHFSRMQNSAHRMQNLIQDLIAYSRTNVQEINFETVDILEVIEDVKETLSEELEQNNVSFEYSGLCEIKIIPIQFKQIVHNLMSNSIKFAKNQEPLIIEISCETKEGKTIGIDILEDSQNYCHIRFADNGIGFEQQYGEKIFEVFQRLHGKDEYEGTGIGLAIVKRIIENHNGAIVANGKLNEGAIFDIYIPAV